MDPALGADRADATGGVTSTLERQAITPEQFLAELEAAGHKTTEEVTEASKTDAEKVEAKPAEGEKTEAKTEDGEKKTETDPNGDKPDGEKVEAKAEDEKPADGAEAKAESDDVKAARKIYAAAARKEAAQLKVAQENKQLRETIETLTKLRDGDELGLLQSLGFGQGAEKDPVKDLLGRIVRRGEKPTPTADDRIAALEKELADSKANNMKAAEAAVITRRQNEITDQIKAGGEKFDLVNALEDYEQVFEVMQESYRVHGVAMDPLVAAAQVEKFHESRIGKSKKFSKAPAAAPKAAATTSNGSKPASDAKGKSETLTNTGSGGADKPADEFPMDDHTARAKAVAKSLGLEYVHN